MAGCERWRLIIQSMVVPSITPTVRRISLFVVVHGVWNGSCSAHNNVPPLQDEPLKMVMTNTDQSGNQLNCVDVMYEVVKSS